MIDTIVEHIKNIKKLVTADSLTKATQIISDTNTFISERLTQDKSVTPAFTTYLAFISIQIFLLSQLLKEVDLKITSIQNFVFSQILVIFFTALAGHLGLKAAKVSLSTYAIALKATLYLYGLGLVLIAICAIIWFQSMINNQTSFLLGLLSFLALTAYWMGRSWNALSTHLGATRGQKISSFLYANVFHIPVMWGFWAISGVLGKAAPL